MKTFIILTISLAGIFVTSCENKDRLEEIKAMLKNDRKADHTEKKKVSFSSPSQNQPKVEENSDSMYEGGDEYAEYDNSYDGESDYNYPEYREDEYEENVDDY